MRFPFYKQYDTTDCGPTCLKSIAEYYGRKYTIQYLRECCSIGMDGVSLLDVSETAENIGFRTKMVKITLEQLRNSVVCPCILFWRQNHFVVLYDVTKKRGRYRYHVSDPAKGKLVYSDSEMIRSWCMGEAGGVALLLEPVQKFYDNKDGNVESTDTGFIFRYLKPYKKYITQILIGVLIACILNFILPFLTQSVVDYGVKNQNVGFIISVLVAQMMIVLGQVVNSLITNWLLLHTTARISITLISDFLNKLTRLPIAFFDSKKTGDILQRVNDHQRIQDFLTGSLLSLIMSIFIFLIYGTIMYRYNIQILIIFIIGSGVYISWVLLFMQKRKKLDYMRFEEASANQNNLLQLICGMQEIKLNGCEKQKRWEWERRQAKLYSISIKCLSINQIQEVGGTFIDQTKNVIISFIAAKSVIDGDMTLGMMMALQYIIGQLNAPIKQFIAFAESGQDARLSLERLTEIHQKRDEESVNNPKLSTIPDKISVSLKNVTFRYGGVYSDNVLNDISLDIPYAKTTAIVGTSGSGKTTLLKLILGFYRPVFGEICVNGKALTEYSDRAWRMNCGVVMQEGYIFSDTIENNITMSDESTDKGRLEYAIKIANLKSFLDSLPLGLETVIGTDGQDLSTGQKQRILIARAVYKNPSFLIFDEATNALDANNERMIMEHLNTFFKGKTVIIVAHRLSTVRKADNIIVLNHSKIVEQGTHEQLVVRKGFYYELIKNQLELGN